MTEFDRSKVGPLPVSDDAGSEQARLLARRRWIRGGLSAPAVLTLMSGGPAAAASNACVARPPGGAGAGVANASALAGTSNTLDVYLRTPLYISKPPTGYTNISWVVFNLVTQPGSLGGVVSSNGGLVPAMAGMSSSWQLFGTRNDSTLVITQGGTFGTYSNNQPTNSTILGYALLRLSVSTVGGVTTVSYDGIGAGNSGVGISGSCWASFHP